MNSMHIIAQKLARLQVDVKLMRVVLSQGIKDFPRSREDPVFSIVSTVDPAQGHTVYNMLLL